MNIQERIAEVLKREPVEAIYDDDSDYLTISSADRLAAVLVAELGLHIRDEWMQRLTIGPEGVPVWTEREEYRITTSRPRRRTSTPKSVEDPSPGGPDAYSATEADL